MVLPFVAWAVTGAIFFIKPGYGGAYESLPLRTYPLEASVSLAANSSWLEARLIRTIAGQHLLVRTAAGWQHLAPESLQPRPAPSESEVRAIIADACASNLSRYGQVVAVNGLTATTDTGVHVTLDWTRLTLSQRGRDTARIDGLYKIHYLQWTGVPDVDRVLGAVGLVGILVLTGLGVFLFFRK